MKNPLPSGGNYTTRNPSPPGPASKGGLQMPTIGDLKSAAVAIATILLIALVINSGVSGSKQQVENKQLDTKVQELQTLLDSLQVEKTRTDESFLQATLEKEQLKTQQAKELAKIVKEATANRSAEVERARKLRQTLSADWYDPRVLDRARQDYVQWEAFACQYYLGLYVLTNAGNVTVPTGCIISNGAYVNSTKFLLDQLSNTTNNPLKAAIGQLEAQYPEIGK